MPQDEVPPHELMVADANRVLREEADGKRGYVPPRQPKRADNTQEGVEHIMYLHP